MVTIYVSRDMSWHCVSSTGYMGRQRRKMISFLQRLLLLPMRLSSWMWFVSILLQLSHVLFHNATFEGTFVLIQVEALRDSFPPSDKSLSRLLGDAPYLPKSVLKLLECLCCPGPCEKSEKEVQSGDRVTQGLSAVWSLILLRPNIRDVCLKIALQVSSIYNCTYCHHVGVFLQIAVIFL